MKLVLALILALLPRASYPSHLGDPPRISTLMKPATYQKMVSDREIIASASLEDLPGPENEKLGSKRYAFYAATVIHASLSETRRILTDYRVYAKIIPYIDRADYSPESRILQLEGGIWKFRLSSSVRFEDRGDRWTHYRIIGGSFTGLEGDIFYESLGEKGTAVYFAGEQTGSRFPPKFVIERGAEIVFGFTARRMRNYVQENSRSGGAAQNDSGQIPQPRSHLPR